MAFVHLRTHTEFSVVDGTLRVDEVVGAAAKDGQVALAITDLSNTFGAIKFYNAARKKGVKPLIGADVWMEPTEGDKQPSRLLLLVQSSTGYLNLCELISRAWLDPSARGQALLKWEWLSALNEGLIALSGAELGAIGQALLAQDTARAQAVAERLVSAFPQRFY
ncbi:MAG: PHP domain-containing protein, partial [Rhizobacter sp.]